MTIYQIITKVNSPITGLDHWTHHEKLRHKRLIKTLQNREVIRPWTYIHFDNWTCAQANVLCHYLNTELWYGTWCVTNHPKLGTIIYYHPHLLTRRGPDDFDVSCDSYHYPFKKCHVPGAWFKVRGPNVHASITSANRPDCMFCYAYDKENGHIIYRAL
jgi:hypothetical protein